MNHLIGISGKKQSGKNTVALIWQYLYDYYSSNYTHPITVKDFKEYVKNNHHLKSVWIQKSFAHKIKQITCILLGCTMEQLEDPIFKETPLGEEWVKYELSYVSHDRLSYCNCTEYYKKYFCSEEEAIKYIEDDLEVDQDSIEISKIELTPRLLLQLLGTECGRQIIHPDIWVTSLLADYRGDVEIWKDIKGYEGEYQISNFGRVKGLDRKIVYGNESKGEYHTKKETILKSTVSGKYEMIKLKGNNSVTIHSLVANHFIPKIKGKSYINHIDQNPLNNFYKNIEWCTQSENIKSANEAGNGNIGTKQADVKLNENKVLLIKKLLFQSKFKQKEIAEKFGVSPTTISDIKHGRKWKHIGQENIKINPILPQKPPNWLVTDVRFFNEAQAIKDRGGILIRVDRDSDSKDSHVSENELDNYKDWDYVIDNNYSLAELILRVRQIMFKEGIIYE